MENLCKQFIKNDSSFIFESCDDTDFNLNKLAQKYKLSIYFYNGKLNKSHRFGKEMFVVYKNGGLVGHYNPGKLAKLPTGVNKLSGCKYKLSDIINQKCCDDCDIETDWSKIEQKIAQVATSKKILRSKLAFKMRESSLSVEKKLVKS